MDLIKSAAAFVRTYLLYPYMSCFVDAKNLPVKSGPLKGDTKRQPVKKENGIFRQLYMLLSMILVTNRTEMIVLFMISMAAAFMPVRGISESGYADEDIPVYSFYVSWILKFLSPLERFLDSLVNEYDMAHATGFTGEENRTLDIAFKVRFFFGINGGGDSRMIDKKIFIKAV
ncbi:MAG: hypothetical protein JXJ19_09880 [Elusimicrobia bacterium]|nr:hypothetical protein [Elusimicrobiota bacterium]